VALMKAGRMSGVMKLSEVMLAMDGAFRFLKRFPAGQAGGLPRQKALAHGTPVEKAS